MSNSSSNPTSNPNPRSNSNSDSWNSRHSSSGTPRAHSPYHNVTEHRHAVTRTQSQHQPLNQPIESSAFQDRPLSSERRGRSTFNDLFRPPIPTFVYIVTSNFTSQTMSDGVNLSESDIIGFQILAVFSTLEDANSYAENECEEIDAGVRRRRIRRMIDGAVGIQEGEGIRAEAVLHHDGTISWTIEDLGQIEVTKWVIQ